MAFIYTWPITVLTPKHVGFWPDGGVRSGPQTLTQLQDFDALDGGPIWRGRMVDIAVYCTDRVKAAKAVQGLAQAGVGLFDIPNLPALRTPAPDQMNLVPHSDGTPFSDGSLYLTGTMTAVLATAADLYTSVIEVLSDQPVEGGDEFSFAYAGIGNRMHRVMRVLDTEETTAGLVYTLEIVPPLREDTEVLAPANFEVPRCTMRMVNAAGFLQDLEWNRWADVTAEFEEAMW